MLVIFIETGNCEIEFIGFSSVACDVDMLKGLHLFDEFLSVALVFFFGDGLQGNSLTTLSNRWRLVTINLFPFIANTKQRVFHLQAQVLGEQIITPYIFLT